MLGRTLLHLAAINNDVHILNQVFHLLERDKSINHTILLSTDIENNWNMLHFAIYNFSLAFVRRVIEYNSPVITRLLSQKDLSSLTPWELLNSLLSFFRTHKLQPHAISLDGKYLTSETPLELQQTSIVATSKVPMTGEPLDLSGLSNPMMPFKISKLVVSATHAAFITGDGQLYSRGQNVCGQLGLGNFRSQSEFQHVDFFKDDFIIDVEVTTNFTILLTSSGQLYACGDNQNLQMGTDSIGSSSAVPQLLTAKRNPSITNSSNRKPSSGGPMVFETLLGNNSSNDLGPTFKGVTCSSNNAIAYTNNSLHFFGTNKGHFGTPALNSTFRFDWKYDEPIKSVLALDTATLVLTENAGQIHIYMNSFHVKLTNVPGTTLGKHEWAHFRPVVISKPKKVIRLIKSNYQANIANYAILLLYEHGEVQQMIFPKDAATKDQLLAEAKYSIVWKPKNTEMRAQDVLLNDAGFIFVCTAGGEVLRRSLKTKTKWNRLRGFENIQSLAGFKGESLLALRNEVPMLMHELIQPQILVDIGRLSPLSGLASDDDVKLNQPVSRNINFIQTLVSTNDDDHEKHFKPSNYKSMNLDRFLLNDDFMVDFFALHSKQNMRYYDYTVYVKDTTLNEELEIPVNYGLLSARLGFVFGEGSIRIEKRDLSIIINTKDHGGGLKIVGDMNVKSVAVYIHHLYTNETLDLWRLHPEDLGDPNSQIRKIKAGWDKLLYTLPVKDSLNNSIFACGTLSDGDVVIHLEDTQIKTWKFILSARCEFFRLTLADHWKLETVLELGDVDLATWTIIMRYFVNGDFNNLFGNLKAYTAVDDFINIVLKVCMAADKFLLPELSSICQLAIKEYISLDNYPVLLQHAWVLGLDQLFSNLCWFIFANIKLCLFDGEFTLKKLDSACVAAMESRFKDIVSIYFKHWKRPDRTVKTNKKSKKFRFQLPLFEYETLNVNGFDMNLFLSDRDRFNGYYFHPILWKVLPEFFNEADVKRHEYSVKRRTSTVKIQLSDNARQQQVEIQSKRHVMKNNENAISDDSDDFIEIKKKGRRNSSRSHSNDRPTMKTPPSSGAKTPPIKPDAPPTSTTSAPTKSDPATSTTLTLDEILRQNQAAKKKPAFKSSVFKMTKQERLEQQKKLFGPTVPVQEPVVKLNPWGTNTPKVISPVSAGSSTSIAIVEPGMATSLSQKKFTNVHFPSLGELSNPKKKAAATPTVGTSPLSRGNGAFTARKAPVVATGGDTRTLEEIRAEAEFERWWAEESKRVQADTQPARGRSGRSRRGRKQPNSAKGTT